MQQVFLTYLFQLETSDTVLKHDVFYSWQKRYYTLEYDRKHGYDSTNSGK